MSLRDVLQKLDEIQRHNKRQETVTISLPSRFAFTEHGIYDFDNYLAHLDWSLQDKAVRIDLSTCTESNFQSVTLLILYAWRLRSQGCIVSFIEGAGGASQIFQRLGARGCMTVLTSRHQKFKSERYKPLFAVREAQHFKEVIESADSYTKSFDVEYKETLRYVLSELLYNTLEHGSAYLAAEPGSYKIPSLAQFTWYEKRREIHFIIGDVGIGIKQHIEQAYPGQESHEDAIKLAIQAKRSGTFGRNDPYSNKDNAGMGLYISSSIIRQLNADMYIVSGNGLVHISPRDTTGKTLQHVWPGTFVLITLRIDKNPTFELHQILAQSRAAALDEQHKASQTENVQRHYLNIVNFFGRYAEDKEAAIKYRNQRLFKAIDDGLLIVVDFQDVESSPHSFLSALLASPIKRLGMQAYKLIKIVNATPEIRETIDFILDDNT